MGFEGPENKIEIDVRAIFNPISFDGNQCQ